MSVRSATLDDAPAIAAVHVAAWRAAYAALMPEDVLAGTGVEAREAMWRRVLEGAKGAVFVVEPEGRVRGFVHVTSSRDDDAPPKTAEITALYLDAAQWGRGHGHELLARALSEATSRGFLHVTLWVFEANERARAFYEAHGFALDAARKVHARSGLTEVRYRRELAAS